MGSSPDRSVNLWTVQQGGSEYTKSDMSTFPYPVEDRMFSAERKMLLRDRAECD